MGIAFIICISLGGLFLLAAFAVSTHRYYSAATSTLTFAGIVFLILSFVFLIAGSVRIVPQNHVRVLSRSGRRSKF